MNYLAHAFLSNNDDDLLIGNFIADHLRGNQFENYSPGIIKGIYLHRNIDTFTDSHPEFKRSKRLFYNGFEKHSGILVDIYFDHLLAKNFNRYSTLSLPEFSEQVYKVYTAHEHLLPKSSAGFLDYVIKNNIYASYATEEGIERVLYHLSQRIKHRVQLDHSITLFREHKDELQVNFDVFFREAVECFQSAVS